MAEDGAVTISRELGLKSVQVLAVAALLEEGATVPFMARYRKERTGGLDEVQICAVRDRLSQLKELTQRREAIFKTLTELGTLTEELRDKLSLAQTLSALEDIYLPFRPRRKTRGTMAREKGLSPLADLLFQQGPGDARTEARAYVNPELGVEDEDGALAGARDILAEGFNEDGDARAELRALFTRKATLRSRVVKTLEKDGAKFKAYFDWEEPLANAPSHRILAVFRGTREGFLRVQTRPPEEEGLEILERRFVRSRGSAAEQVRLAVRDAYKRLLAPSMEAELKGEAKKRADQVAIRIFGENLRNLLLAPPLGARRVLALDPGLRTGCKLVCLDEQGGLLHHSTIYPLAPRNQTERAGNEIRRLVKLHRIEVLAVGNGTGGREGLRFLKDLSLPQPAVMVNEAGASVYSASALAREEFPDHDVTVRGAVSIGRRLLDPLAELVKIDPKSIGVGQYQHDVSQKDLRASLNDVVVSCVNAVGVDVNTASAKLLEAVSGLSPRLASNMAAYRSDHGPFPSRTAIKKVKGLGPKAFEQCAGFLRIPSAKNPLDDTAVHPESYGVVKAMAGHLGCSLPDLIAREELRKQIQPERYVTSDTGLPTVKDILDALGRAGRDPREPFDPFSFEDTVMEMSDLEPDMVLPGVVTNVTAFGAFVDIGVHQDGLIHISQMADRFVRDPAEIVSVNQKVKVRVLSVDLERKRIGLSLKIDSPGPR